MNPLVKALLGTTCLTALSAGGAKAGVLVVPDLPLSAARVIAGGPADATGAIAITGSIAALSETSGDPSGSGSHSEPTPSSEPSPSAGDAADWFRIDLAPGQPLTFVLTVGVVASGESLPDDAIVVPDGSGSAPSGSTSGLPTTSGAGPAPSGALDPIFSSFVFEVLDSNLDPLALSKSSEDAGGLSGLLTVAAGGPVFFGLRDFSGPGAGLSYSFAFRYGEVPATTVAAPSGLAAAAGAAVAGGLGFLRRRRKQAR